MTTDERNLLLLLAKMVLCSTDESIDKDLIAAIAKIENAESKRRDEFVNGIMKGILIK